MSKNISFISESVLEEKRKQRQEEWLKNRKESDSINAPEPEYDPRTLYERLQEQKQKKQEEYDEMNKLKNLIKGLDDDEIKFLNYCNENKLRQENDKYYEELMAIEEYKNGLKNCSIEEQELRLLQYKRELFHNNKRKNNVNDKSDKKIKSQAQLLNGAIKRKSVDNQNQSSSSSKQIKNDIKDNKTKPTIQCIGRLPGIGCYDDDSDSLESDRDSNESDVEDFNAFGHKLAQLTQAAAEMQKK